MKKYAVLMVAAMLMIGMSVSAQNGQRGQRNNDSNRQRQAMSMTAKERADWMAKQLDLTADQKVKVEALYEKQDAKRKEQMEKFREQREKMTENRDNTREEMRAQREKEMKENQAELESIIGKEKMEKLNSLRQSRQNTPRRNL